MNYKLSICLPGYRTHLWEQFYNTAAQSIGDHTWELIMVGPNDPPPFFEDKKNFKFVKDFGSPARCGQIAVSLAEGELMMWGSDDGFFRPNNAISNCIAKHDTIGYKDAIALRYTEGSLNGGTESNENYFFAHHHSPLRFVPEDYMILCVGMAKTKYFRELGGWDCRFEQLNLNTHDFSFRLQRDGGKIYKSDLCVSDHTWSPESESNVPVQSAFEKDYELFREIYYDKDTAYLKRPIKIDLFNWVNSPKVWERRFGSEP